MIEQPNVFALVTAAHLLTQQTRGQLVKRLAAKGRLARLLFERQWDRQRIIDLFNVIDWMMRLPESLQTQLMRDIEELERKHQMPYISSFERRGIQKGQSDLLTRQLEKRFGPLPPAEAARVATAPPRQLEAWGLAMIDAPTLDAVFASR